MFVEIEHIVYAGKSFCLVVYLGSLVWIKPKEISSYIYTISRKNVKPRDIKDLREFMADLKAN